MKRYRRILSLFLSLLPLAGGLALAAPADPFPPVEIPGIPDTGEYCLWRFNKSFDGVHDGAHRPDRNPSDPR